jgi:RNA polymerase sigma-70 factor (ECF subfamily)
MTERVRDRRSADVAESDRHLRELMDTYREPLTAYARQLAGGDADRAEDAVQETFVRAWRHLDRLTPDRGPVLGWLRRVVHNLVMDGHRSRRARPTEVAIEHAAEVMTADPTTAVLDSMLVEQVLRDLWPQHRAALVDVYLRERTAAEISASLGVPVGTIKSRVHYALRAARAALAERSLRAA